MPDIEEFSIEDIAASISQREAAGPDPQAGLTAALDQPTEIKPQAAAEESARVEEPVVEPAQAASNDTVATPDPVEAPKPLLATPPVAQKQDVEPAAKPEDVSAFSQALERANATIQQLEVAAAGKFSDLKTKADVFQLMQTDPARYNEFVIFQSQLNDARQAQTQVQQEAARAFVVSEQKRLQKAIPDLADPVKGQALKDDLRAYAKSVGIPDDRQARNADEVIRLHSEMKLAKEVAEFRAKAAAQEKALEEATKKAAKAPEVQKPGTARNDNANTKLQELEDRFNRTGRTDDLALLLAARSG